MKIRVSAYAEDGAAVSSVVVEVETDEPRTASETIAVATELIVQVVDALAGADDAEPVGASHPDTITCSRLRCGHSADVHGERDDRGTLVSKGRGACSLCGSVDLCRSFVPPPRPVR